MKSMSRPAPRPLGNGGPSRLIGALLLALSGLLTATAQDLALLESVDIGSLPGDRVQIRFRLSRPMDEPASFTVNDPARIVLDFPGARSGLDSRRQAIGRGVAESLHVLEGPGRTRATLKLARMVPYQLSAQGNTVVLTLEPGSVGRAAPGVAASPPIRSSIAGPREINRVDFRRGPSGQALIGITLSDPSTAADVRLEGNRIVADFAGARLPRGQERRLDVTDFATPVTLVDALNRDGGARISVQPTGEYEYLAYQSENLYTIEIKPVIKDDDEDLRPEKKVYTGEVLSLNFQDIEVRAVLQILADFTGLNVVVSDTVQGNLTLRLQNVPWDQALDIILRTKGLTMRQNGNVIYVAPTEEIAAREKLELEARKQITELAPLRSELIQVNYAKAADLGGLLKSEGSSLLSARGQVTVDDRTNSLLVQDVADHLVEVRDLVTRLDVPVRQVMIDARVVIARDDFSKELGVRFGASGVRRNGDEGVFALSGSATTIDGSGAGATAGIVNSVISNLNSTGQPFPVSIPSIDQRLGVRLGTSQDPFGRLAMALLGRDYLLDLELSALQAEGRGETLSNPRVITTDRTEAFIKQGREIPYQVVSEDGVNIQFKEAKLELIVTPQITPDNRVIMDLRINKNEQGQNVSTGTGGSVPSIDTREIRTQVLVDNGETVVLGGVFEQVTSKTLDKVPFLGDIPAVGRLFQRRGNTNNKLELLIFVTPQIVTGDLAAR